VPWDSALGALRVFGAPSALRGKLFCGSFDLLVLGSLFRVGLDGLCHGSRWLAWASKGIDSRCPLLADHPALATPWPALSPRGIAPWAGLGLLLSDKFVELSILE
jgi:hypothetical protein